MINVADNNAIYYYHYDGLGSVVALSDSYGNSAQSYEYSAFGQVAASDPNFTANPWKRFQNCFRRENERNFLSQGGGSK